MDARALGFAHAVAPRRALDEAGAPAGGAYGSKP
jgi:hypothetical protein